jgi:GntR family transcriptional regulator
MFISINENDNRPIYVQIINQIKAQVRSGALQPGDELPSVREAADSLRINMHTVRSAYLKLRDQGIIKLHLGRRAIIAQQLSQRHANLETEIKARLNELITDALLTGIPLDDLRKLINQQLDQLKKE